MFAALNQGQYSPKTRPRTNGVFSQAKELQELIMEDARSEELKPLIRAGLARAFVELEMLKLRLRMKPAPKPIDVSQKPAKSKTNRERRFIESQAEAVIPKAHQSPCPTEPSTQPRESQAEAQA